jgi:hypothetical protein
MRFLPALAALLASAQAVEAECLDAGDLGRGVVVSFDNGDATTMRRMSDGSIQVDEVYADGSPTLRLRAAHGIYFFEEYSLDAAGEAVPGSRLRVEFPQDPRTLPKPAAGATWSGETVNLFEDGGERRETTSASFGPGAPLVLGDCSYETLAATLRYD